MSQPMLLAQVEQAEAQLGQPLPADYRAFLLDDANEDTEEWGFFTTPKEFLYYELGSLFSYWENLSTLTSGKSERICYLA